MSSIIWDKMDSGLQSLYVNFLKLEENEWKKGIWRHPALVDGPQKIFLTLHYTNALSEIEVLGFETDFKKPENAADGLVDLSKLKEIIDHPNVLKLFYGSEMEPFLETSAAEIEARKKNGADSTFVWTVNQTTGAFTGNTGKGVIVGIIDTGIDWKHDAFLENTGIKTRILSIWDQGLTPQGSESSPPANMLSGGNTTYGVEYKKTAIDKVLDGTNPQTTIRTKDCSGHGTHVAATAAGNGRQAALNNSPRFEFTGIAPEADIVVVKLLHLAKNPSGVSALKRFKDAISFINKMGDDSNKPVVINCSFGHDVGPHDGLSEEMDGQEVFLEQTFANVAKKICVFAAGNAAGKKTHAVISLPASGEVEIPLELYDKRIFKERFDKCSYESNTRAIDLEIWYKKQTTGPGIKAALKVAGSNSFSSDVTLGNDITNRRYNRNKFYSIIHEVKKTKRNGVDFERNVIRMVIDPHKDLFKTGDYKIRLKGPQNEVLHLWCGRGSGFGLRLGTVTSPGPVNITDLNTLGHPGSTPSVITVGAYDDVTGHVGYFSGQGPLVDYSGLGVLATKPDICAPGVRVFAARSYDARVSIRRLKSHFINGVLGYHYNSKSGTSMAAPHIAGVVALMLQKNANLKVADVKSHLKDASVVRPAPKAIPDPSKQPSTTVPNQPAVPATTAGAGKVNAQGSVNKTPNP